MLATNDNFDALHALRKKTPMYVLEFDGVSYAICNHQPSDVNKLTYLATISEGGTAQCAWGDGTYIYFVDGFNGIYAYTFDGSSFSMITNRDDGGTYYSVWGDDTYIYVANYGDGIRAYSFNGTSFSLLDTLDDGGEAYNTWGDGIYIYLANGTDGLRAYTFNGSVFTNVGHIDDGGTYYGVWGDETYIYAACAGDGVRAYTFNGSTFTLAGSIDNGGTYYSVWGDGTYIYTACGSNGLRAYIFNGSAFTLIDTVMDTGAAYYTWGDGNYIFLANFAGGLIAYTFENAEFVKIDQIDTTGYAFSLWGDGSYIYLINYGGYMRAYSISDVYKKYLEGISGISQTVTPEEGKASITGVSARILDRQDEITAALSSDSVNYHRKKVVVKAGYLGLSTSDLINIRTGWVTGLKLSDDLTSWIYDITDPQKWLQRPIFRNAETTPVVLQGNAINILLAILTSTGAGTNGDYDWYEEHDGLGLTSDFANIAALEKIRDDWYPGDSHHLRIMQTEPIKAKDFIEEEILQVLNCYPIVDGQGRYSIAPFKPPLATVEQYQTYDNDVIIGRPKFDLNFSALINEAAFHVDHDGDDFATVYRYVNGTSISARGPGKKPITIKSKGLHTDLSPSSINPRAEAIIAKRWASIQGRYLTPPLKVDVDAWFSRFLTEAGDIVTFSHPKLPNMETGDRGLSARRMEVIKQSIDWKNGKVGSTLLDTGFGKGKYGSCSPVMTVTAGNSGTAFTVSVSDAALWTEGWEAQVLTPNGYPVAASITILTINTSTGAVTCDDIGQTPAAGWKIVFANYDNCTDDQKLYGFIADAGDTLGAADENPFYCSP